MRHTPRFSEGRAALLLGLLLAGPPVGAGEVQELLDTRILPGSSTRHELMLTETFGGAPVMSPVLVVSGTEPGPRLCLTGAVHGDELNGVEVVRRVLDELDPASLRGSVVGLPIVNVPAFRNGSRYLADRRDLNRFFPGSASGSLAARIAHQVFGKVIRHCDLLVDVHTGSAGRANLPQVRADTDDDAVVRLARSLGGLPVIHKKGSPGTLRVAAIAIGIPAVTLEVGEAHRIDRVAIGAAVAAVRDAMRASGMLPGAPAHPGEVFRRSRWLRASEGGIFFSQVKPGDAVTAGHPIGEIVDPVSSARVTVHADHAGLVIGVANEQMVMPGNALAHVAIRDN